MDEALKLTEFSPKKAARFVSRVVRVTANNAYINHNIKDTKNMYIMELYVGKVQPRQRCRARPQAPAPLRAAPRPLDSSPVAVANNREDTALAFAERREAAFTAPSSACASCLTHSWSRPPPSPACPPSCSQTNP